MKLGNRETKAHKITDNFSYKYKYRVFYFTQVILSFELNNSPGNGRVHKFRVKSEKPCTNKYLIPAYKTFGKRCEVISYALVCKFIE